MFKTLKHGLYLHVYVDISYSHDYLEELFKQQAEKGAQELRGNAIELEQWSTQVQYNSLLSKQSNKQLMRNVLGDNSYQPLLK